MTVFLVGLLNAGLFALLTPAWQAPDEPGHFEYACLLGQLRRPLHGHDRSPVLQQEIIASLARHDFWPRVREPWPQPLPTSFTADRFLLRSARQVGDEPLAYYLAPAAICRLPLSTEAQARLMRLYGALLFGLTAAATAWGWSGGRPETATGAVSRLHPLVLALLPMPAFIAGSINNDSLALLSATLVFAAVLRGQRLGWTWPRGLAALALLALALVSKKTNFFLAPWLALLALGELWRWLGRRGWSRRRRLAGLVAVTAATVVALSLPTPLPAGWRGIDQLPEGGRRRAALPDGPGWAALVVDRSARREGRLYQELAPDDVRALAGQPITATLWVRSADGRPAPGRLVLRDAAGFSQTPFVAGNMWQPVTVQHTLAITATHARLVLFPTQGQTPQETGALLAAAAAARGARGQTLLRNGDFAQAAPWGELVGVGFEQRWRQFAPGPLAGWQAPQRSLLYLALTFAGFWGNYGWLQAPLPVALYAILALITAAAAAGLWRRWRRDVALRPILAAWLLAVLLIALQTFLPMIGRDWQPQGRYLFPALLPLTGLLLLGLDAWLAFGAAAARRVGLLVVLLAFNGLALAIASGALRF